MKKIIIILILAMLVPIRGFGMIVFDPTNYGRNVITASNMVKMVQTAAEQLSALKGQLDELKAHYGLDLTDLKKLAGLGSLLANNDDVINNDNGNSDYAELANLNPQSSDYAKRRDAILSEYYHEPEDPSVVAQQFRGILSADEMNTLTADAQQNKKFWDRVLDEAEVVANQKVKEEKRKQEVERYDNNISKLGDKSELQTSQLIAAETHLSLQQNEEELASLHAIQQAQTEEMTERISAKSEDFENEQKRLLKASQQGTSGFGRDRWGDL